jgi:hypothetical protein
MSWSPTLENALYLSYRFSAYVLINLGEDAALVAFMFC